ncbi:kinase-like domain-containing protein [Hyaloraphidium curvatum]|nr:kinase-like domain-containing protein [Hyaloraphidium curvatum]
MSGLFSKLLKRTESHSSDVGGAAKSGPAASPVLVGVASPAPPSPLAPLPAASLAGPSPKLAAADAPRIPFASGAQSPRLGPAGAADPPPLPAERTKKQVAAAVEAGERKRKLYKEVKKLGQGVSGYVSAAVHAPSGTPVAVKHVVKGSLFKASHVAEALTEIAILTQLHHPNVIQLLDWFETKEHVCLVFEQAAGGELFDRIEQLGHYTERDAACIAAVLCNALAYVHAKGVLHRDLKTHNVLFSGPEFDSRIVLVDFGISKQLRGPTDFTTTVGMGTPSFTAPEVIEGVKYTSKCDDWSMGVLAHHLLCGYGPFDGGVDYMDILAKQAKGPQFDSEEWKPISAEAKDFVKRLLTISPRKRMTAAEALDHPWIRNMVPETYLSQLKSINDQLLGIAPAPVKLPEPALDTARTADDTALLGAGLDAQAQAAKELSTTLSRTLASPLAISQTLNRQSAELPNLIPDLSSTSPIPVAGAAMPQSAAASPDDHDSLPDIRKVESTGSVELPGLTLRRTLRRGTALSLTSLTEVPAGGASVPVAGAAAAPGEASSVPAGGAAAAPGEILDWPPSMLKGISEEKDKTFAELHIKTVRDLGNYKYAIIANAIATLAELEEHEGEHSAAGSATLIKGA